MNEHIKYIKKPWFMHGNVIHNTSPHEIKVYLGRDGNVRTVIYHFGSALFKDLPAEFVKAANIRSEHVFETKEQLLASL